MKRIVIIGLGAAAVVAALAVAVPQFISADIIKLRIAENIAALTGREVTLRGAPTLAIYPNLSITVSGLTVANPPGVSGEPFLTSDSVTARVRLLPLLLGNAQFDSIELTKPRIHLVANAAGAGNWTLIPPAKGVLPVSAPPRRLRMTAGTVVYDNVAAGQHEEFSQVDLDASWPDPQMPLMASGTVHWRGEALDFNGQVGDPQIAATGGASPVRLAIAGKPVRLTFTGTVGASLNGTVAVSTPALRRMVDWLGRPMDNGSTLGAASLKAKVDWAGREVLLADATVELDGNSVVGAFTIDYSGARPMIAGTATTAKLDLSPYLEAWRTSVSNDTTTLLAPAGIPLVDVMDADLKVSADELIVGKLHAKSAAGSISTGNGGVALTIGQADFYGGTLTADASIGRYGDVLSAKGDAKLTMVAARPALGDLLGIDSVDGAATADVHVATQGKSWAEFAQRMSGRGTFGLANGAVSGIDLATLVGLADAAGPISPGGGALKFDAAGGSIALDAGIVETTDTVVKGDGYRMDVKGWSSLSSGLVDARATLAPGKAKAVPIAVSGTWRRPLLDLDRDHTAGAIPAPRG